MAACPDVPCELVTAQPWTVSLHLPTVAARLAVVDPEVRPLDDGPGFRLGQGMEVTAVRLPNPGASLRGSTSHLGMGPMCGQRSTAGSRMHGIRPCGPLSTTD